jgi:hypothetical protein
MCSILNWDTILFIGGNMADWVMHLTSNQWIAAWVQTQSGASRCFLEQETLHKLLSTGWFKKQI